jgi:hypothetical protein
VPVAQASIKVITKSYRSQKYITDITVPTNIVVALENTDIPPEPLFIEIPFYDPSDLDNSLEGFADIAPEPLSHEISFYDPDSIPDWMS